MEYSARGVLIFGIPPYWFWAGLGFLISIIFYMVLLFRNNHKVQNHIPMLGFGAIGLVFGAKLLGCITKLLTLHQEGNPITIEAISTSGIVFYGGVLGLVSFLIMSYKIKYRTIPWDVLDLLAMCIPLFHSFARLGCFFGGCCYGRLSDSPLAIIYETNQLDAAYRLPVQIFEACGVLVIFLVLVYLRQDKRFQSHLLKTYFIAYAILRFFIEFCRGDSERGVWGFISLSQIISILILCTILVYSIFRGAEKNGKNN